MREILFKAKRKDKGEWVEGYVFDNGETNLYKKKIFIGSIEISEYKWQCCDKWNIDGICFEEVYPETLCQYTGVKDRNGKKIFEGDILSFSERGVEKTCEATQECTATFRGTGFRIDAKLTMSRYRAVEWVSEFFGTGENTNFEIVGNIHDKEERG